MIYVLFLDVLFLIPPREPFYYTGNFDKKEMMDFVTSTLLTSDITDVQDLSTWKSFVDSREGKPVVLLYVPAGDVYIVVDDDDV